MCVTLIFCSSCITYGNIVFIHENEDKYFVYQDNEYHISHTLMRYDETPYGSDVKLGEYYSFPFGTYFYSYTTEIPNFIYTGACDKNVYLKNGYDYKSEVFVIKNTSEKIVLSNAISDAYHEYDSFYDYYNSKEITMYCENHPNLYIRLQLFYKNNNWYVAFSDDEAYLASQEFLCLLMDNKIIPSN